mgnify:CR=1 FL=1
MEQKDMNNLSPAELKAMADTLLAADDEKQANAKTKAAPAAKKPAAAEKPEVEKTTEELNYLEGQMLNLSACEEESELAELREERARARTSWCSRT